MPLHQVELQAQAYQSRRDDLFEDENHDNSLSSKLIGGADVVDVDFCVSPTDRATSEVAMNVLYYAASILQQGLPSTLSSLPWPSD